MFGPIDDLLRQVADGRLSVDDAARRLIEPYDDLGFAKVDSHRADRTGFPEAIYCPGKSPEQIAAIAASLVDSGQTVIATKASAEDFAAVRQALPGADYNEAARVIAIAVGAPPALPGSVAVITGGSSDIPIAEEAAITAAAYGAPVARLWDVGVAGIHRLLRNRETLDDATVLVAVAGMEGALPSVVAGLVDKPVIAVPTSVGYGAAFQGLAPLLAMLNSCAPGVSVVNIDNGFGAGYLAAQICRSARDSA
ncbi:MAG: nickel pincer cofactor biosynthesis protein LarB [Chloroflexota bacterium]|jgi:hypothetical protein|nr:nickel pincer cofactor biosynthesis protein LarB [Chloroflexota bacterium]MDP6757959.1 nickel pincer cofactor biosynthesis protein LarB [Chloroflexota bacterium]